MQQTTKFCRKKGNGWSFKECQSCLAPFSAVLGMEIQRVVLMKAYDLVEIFFSKNITNSNVGVEFNVIQCII